MMHSIEKKTIKVVAGLIYRDGALLVCRRRADGAFPLKWEFPGGKVLSGELPAEAAVRECREETGLEVVVTSAFDPIVHTYAYGTLELHFFRCRLAAAGAPHPPFAWVAAEDMARLQFPAANQPILAALAAEQAKPDSRTAR